MSSSSANALIFALLSLSSCRPTSGSDPDRRGHATSHSKSEEVEVCTSRPPPIEPFRPDDFGSFVTSNRYNARVANDGAVTLSANRDGKSEAIRLRTESMEIGARTMEHAAQPVLASNGSVNIERIGARENLKVQPDGVEQSWTLDAQPIGTDALKVVVRFEGARVEGRVGDALLLATTSGAQFRYGPAYWVDADGRRTNVSMRWTETSAELEVSRKVLDESTYPAVLDPVIGAAFQIEAPGLVAVPPRETVITRGATEYLAIWGGHRPGDPNWRLMATRVDSSGNALDPHGIDLAKDVRGGFAAVWDGENYFVVMGGLSGVRGVHVTPGGTVVEATPLQLAPATLSVGAVSVAYLKDTYLVAWDRTFSDGSRDVEATRVSVGGEVLDAVPLAIATGFGDHGRPSVVASNAAFLVTYADFTGRFVNARRVDVGGSILDPIAITLCERICESHSTASDGSGWAVAWAAAPMDYFGDIGIASISAEGFVSPEVEVVTGPAIQETPSLSWNGASYVLVWEEIRPVAKVVGSVLTADLQVPPTGPVLITDAPYNTIVLPRAACSPSECLVVIAEDGDRTVVFQPSRVAAPGPQKNLNFRTAYEMRPAVAWNGSVFLAAWRDERGIYGARITREGIVLDPQGIKISSRSEIPGLDVSVASDGAGFLVAWRDDSRARAARIDGSGTLLDTVPLVLNAEGLTSGPIASGGNTGYLVVWRTPSGVVANHVSSTGAVLQSGGFTIRSAQTVFSQPEPGIAFNGSAWLVAWGESGSNMGATYAALVAADGNVGPLINVANGVGVPRVAFDGTEFGIALGIATRLKKISASGDVIAAPAAQGSSWNSKFRSASLTWDGSAFVHALDAFIGPTTPMLVERFDKSGLLVGTLNVVGPSYGPSVASEGAGTTIYVDYLDDAHDVTRPLRVRARILKNTLLGIGSPCVASVDCTSGFCADGVCCDRACGGAEEDCEVCSQAKGAISDGVCGIAPAGTTCRPGPAPCDAPEVCDGVSPMCPPDELRGVTHECRPASGPCDAPEMCSGTMLGCPFDEMSPNGQVCDDADICSLEAKCFFGQCRSSLSGPDGVQCDDADPCTVGDACASGRCSGAAFAPDGTACNDGDLCTSPDTCTNGKCVAGTKMACPTEPCHAAPQCVPSSGVCPPPKPLPNGTKCDDGNACTDPDACIEGTCVATAVECGVPGPCFASSCQPDGMCRLTMFPEDTPCDDGLECTPDEVCKSGICTGVEPDCGSSPECMRLGDCARCTFVPLDDGVTCATGECVAGACVPIEKTEEETGCGGCSGSPGVAWVLAMWALGLRRRKMAQ